MSGIRGINQKIVYKRCDDCNRTINLVEGIGYCARCEKNTLCSDCCSEVKVAHYYMDNAFSLEKFCSSCSAKLKLLLEIGNTETSNINRSMFTFKPKNISAKTITKRRYWQTNFRGDNANSKPNYKAFNPYEGFENWDFLNGLSK